MKLPELFQSIFKRKSNSREIYVSLYLDALQVAGSFFTIEQSGAVMVLASRSERLKNDSWEERSVVVDELLGLLEEKTGHTDVTKAILGLPPLYLTATGEIQKEVRIHIKQFMKELELQAIGFVPLQQAIIFKMRHDEGVPPSVILLGINSHCMEVGVYKVGELSGVREIEKHEDVVDSVEQGLRSFTDIEVLPARIMLYGSSQEELEDVKSILMKHQWTSRVNFLHFPKIETISEERIVESISFAGASELGAAMGDIEPSDEAPTTEPEETVSEDVLPPPDSEISKSTKDKAEELVAQSAGESDISEVEQSNPEDETHVAIADVTPLKDTVESKMSEEVAEAQEVISEDFSVDDVTTADANVVMVDAESLGFKKDVDVLEKEQLAGAQQRDVEGASEGEDDFDDEDEEEVSEERGGMKLPALPHISFSGVSALLSGVFGRSTGKKPVVAVVLGIIALLGLGGFLYWLIPGSTVTILEIPKTFQTSQSITIDPTATTVDAQQNIIPGRKRDKAETGEKTVPVNGKKNVGDPAKGTVTIYNKSTTVKTLKKGTVLTSKSLQFSLDQEVQISAATVSGILGGETKKFGTQTASITALAIGSQSNMPSGTEFTFKEYGSDVMIATNEKALAGGTSREVTVVSRSDYDSFVKTVSAELTEKAKQGFAQVVTGSEKIIDATIKTTVTEKVFNQEIDEEATQLEGKLTVTMSAVAYAEADVRALLSSLSASQVPSGYVVNDAKTTVTVSDVQVKKDGSITGKATMQAYALPVLDTEKIRSDIAGKSISFVQNYVKNLPGVGGILIGFRYSPTKSMLPLNKKNISVTVSFME